MKNNSFSFIMAILIVVQSCGFRKQPSKMPVTLHPKNPNYFLYQGKPTILITSGEHYGAVMNTGFNFEKYLQTLANEGFNYTRIFTGAYSEMGSTTFGIENNTMNPAPGTWLTPWPYDKSSGKYQLSKWNPDYFGRLHRFMKKASELGIVVEVSLFTSYYADNQWNITPFNPKNNFMQGIDSLSFKELNTTHNGSIMDVQEAYVRKMVMELNVYPNFIFEIQNEPWSDNPHFVEKFVVDSLVKPAGWQRIVETANETSLEWQKRIAGFITSEENQLPQKHLIAQNFSNFRCKVTDPDPRVSILNFHYAYPEAAFWNLHLKRPLALDETGFMPHEDIYYRSEAWKFMLAGGATYNNLDYSFTVGNEDGRYSIASRTPGWGGVDFRCQIRVLKKFIEGFDFIEMKPVNHILKFTSGSMNGYGVLAQEGKQYAIYLLPGKSPEAEINIPDGKYNITWIDPITGSILESGSIVVSNNRLKLEIPEYKEDIALKIFRE